MPKLTLKLEALCVETFTTEPALAKKGTVMGAQDSAYTVCTCPGYYTCDYACSNACSDGCVPPTNGLRTCVRCPHEY